MVRRKEMTTVITYGTFDTFHYGHLELLKRSKELGDKLIVAVSTDEFNSLKGKKSVFSYEKRYEWVSSIKFVDLVIPENNWEQKDHDVIKYDINILTMGDDWTGKFDYLPCKVIYLDRTPEISSTAIKGVLK
jgi:glycerol-3-phosphate cytidylyltransferase